MSKKQQKIRMGAYDPTGKHTDRIGFKHNQCKIDIQQAAHFTSPNQPFICYQIYEKFQSKDYLDFIVHISIIRPIGTNFKINPLRFKT